MNPFETLSLAQRLAGNDYPGRGIMLGLTPDGRRAAAAYYGWQVVQCVQGDRLRTPEEIHQEIYRLVQRCLEE